MPIPSVEAKTKKTTVQDDPAQQKKHKNKKEKKKAKGKVKKMPRDIIAYTSLCLENPKKLAKCAIFYHSGSDCIGLDINRIDITSDPDIMCSIYAGKRLKSFTEDSQKATWKLMQRYYTARLLAQGDYKNYQDFKKSQRNNSNDFAGLLANVIVISITGYIEQEAIFERMVPYMAGLYSIKKQVQLSKINLVTLATTAPILYEPVVC